jgi:hypothetical protein
VDPVGQEQVAGIVAGSAIGEALVARLAPAARGERPEADASPGVEDLHLAASASPHRGRTGRR